MQRFLDTNQPVILILQLDDSFGLHMDLEVARGEGRTKLQSIRDSGKLVGRLQEEGVWGELGGGWGATASHINTPAKQSGGLPPCNWW